MKVTRKATRKIQSGKLFNAYFENEADSVYAEITNTEGRVVSEKEYPSFNHDGRTYIILGFDHFNGHFSNFRDKNAIYGIKVAEIVPVR